MEITSAQVPKFTSEHRARQSALTQPSWRSGVCESVARLTSQAHHAPTRAKGMAGNRASPSSRTDTHWCAAPHGEPDVTPSIADRRPPRRARRRTPHAYRCLHTASPLRGCRYGLRLTAHEASLSGLGLNPVAPNQTNQAEFAGVARVRTHSDYLHQTVLHPGPFGGSASDGSGRKCFYSVASIASPCSESALEQGGQPFDRATRRRAMRHAHPD